jgi:glycosyltransferase involved in cell wall biosynthesis
MRVLHVVKGLGPGGAERLLVSLAQVRRTDVETHAAYVLPHKDQLVSELREAGVACHVLGGARGLADPRWPFRLAHLTREIRPDVVHVHSPAVAAVARPLLRALPGRLALVSTEHNVWGSFGRLTRVANGMTLPLSDAKLAVSEEVRGSVWTRLRDDVRVCLQGIPVARLAARRSERQAARDALDLAEDDVLVVTVANFREKKDYPTLLAAAARCADEPRLRFVVIGQGPLEEEIQARHARLSLGDSMRLLGYHPDPPAVMVGADLFALTSRHEGLPIALLEAMALGVPAIATSVGGIPEVITDQADGILLAPGDHAAFADAFHELAAHSERRVGLGAAAARRARDFDIARTQAELEALYDRLVRSG